MNADERLGLHEEHEGPRREKRSSSSVSICPGPGPTSSAPPHPWFQSLVLPGLLLLTAGLIGGCARTVGEEPRQPRLQTSSVVRFQDVQPGSGIDFPLS